MRLILLLVTSIVSMFFSMFFASAAHASLYSCWEFGPMAYAVWGGKCACLTWYSFDNEPGVGKYCKSNDQICKDEYGYWAKSAWSGQCGCSYGYSWNATQTQCEYQICGRNSSWDETRKSCMCSKGYVSDGKWNCKRPDTLAVITDIRAFDNTAIIGYYDPFWIESLKKIEYWFGCYSIENYLESIVNIETSTQFVSYGDQIKLPGTRESCSITSIKSVDADYTLTTCAERFWENSIENAYDDQMCQCKVGYQWNKMRDACVPIPKKKVRCKAWYTNKNGYCQKISQ